MKHAPLVSVIISCYNQGRYLADALDSVLQQSHPEIEVLVVDDGSTDQTAAVAQRYGDRVRYIFQENRGLSGARNTGIAQAKGRFFQLLDADDRIERDKIRVQVEHFERRPETGIVYGDMRYFKTENPSLLDYGFYAHAKNRPWVPDLWRAPGSVLTKLLSHNLMAVNCPLIRREVFDQVGPFNEELRAHEDWEYWIRCAAAGVKFHFEDLPETLALVRLHECSMTQDRPRMEQSVFVLRLNVIPLLADKGLRTANFKRALLAAEVFGPEGRSRRIWQLACATRTASGAIAALLSWAFGRHGPGLALREWMARVVPWPIQKVFRRFIDLGPK